MKFQLLTIYRMDFNPRTCVRCDYLAVSKSDLGKLFQSTHLREVRLPESINSLIILIISIHAPA